MGLPSDPDSAAPGRNEATLADNVGGGDLLAAGSKVGRYTVERLLGQGGMGTVYVAHDPELDRHVAVKVLHADHAGGTEGHARFVREARLMAKLAHPNVVTIFDVGETATGPYIVMELVDGTSLDGWLEEKARPTAEIVEKYVMAGYALAAAHSAGVVHRDFKPANVLIDRKGRVAVTDFGIASVLERAAAKSGLAAGVGDAFTVTQAGLILGTPAFMSPEQFRGERADARTDQFSFAVALYESLFRQRPFPGQTVQEICAAVLMGSPGSLPRERRERVPARIYDALLRALSREPADRFPSLLVMLREIERAMGASSGGSRRRIKLAAGGVAVGVGVVVAGAAGWVAFRGHAPAGSVAAHSLVGLGGKCIDANGDALELRTCDGRGSQQWRLAEGKLLAADGRCVGSHGASSEKHAALELQRCKDDASQVWHMSAGMLVAGSGMCANVERNRTQDGTPIILFDCRDRAPNEHWRLGGRGDARPTPSR